MKINSKTHAAIVLLLATVVATSEISVKRKETKSIPRKKIYELPATFKNTPFTNLPLDQAIEKRLRADLSVNGIYAMEDNKTLKVFSSVEYKSNYIGTHSEIFEHTPDVCWVNAGWISKAAKGGVITTKIGVNTAQVQRRIYLLGDQNELCYFVSLVDGKTPLGLNKEVSVANDLFDRERTVSSGLRLFANKLLNIIGTIISRPEGERECAQFIRVSINLDSDPEDSDFLLKDFLAKCVFPKDPVAEP